MGNFFSHCLPKVVHCLDETSPLSILTAVAISWLDLRYQQGACNPKLTTMAPLGDPQVRESGANGLPMWPLFARNIQIQGQ